MEIGSFIELDLNDNGEYYQFNDIARLNTARCGIYHALRVLNCTTIYIPYYQCESVVKFLNTKGITIHFYNISEKFDPFLENIIPDSAILIVNYFGILNNTKLTQVASKFSNVIIDNSPAFFNYPIMNCLNVYSTRKFFGVPDGCYVIGKDAVKFIDEYPNDFSSETSSFLLKRIELGGSAAYSDRMQNESRLDNSDISKMSKLTSVLLKNIDYKKVMQKRIDNFTLAHQLYSKYNLINPTEFLDYSCVPIVYPLVVKDSELVNKLKKEKIYTGRWWKHVLKIVPESSFEALLSEFMVPIPIDQRYGKDEITYCNEVIKSLIKID